MKTLLPIFQTELPSLPYFKFYGYLSCSLIMTYFLILFNPIIINYYFKFILKYVTNLSLNDFDMYLLLLYYTSTAFFFTYLHLMSALNSYGFESTACTKTMIKILTAQRK